ncbi:MAG: calcium-binding protein [Pseudomonadota bacterium]
MSWTFLSFPDLFNSDIADFSGGAAADIAALFSDGYSATLPQAPGWQPGDLNAVTADYVSGLLTQFELMSAAAGGDPRAVLIAGDLIGGAWHRDTARVADLLGGPNSTPDEDALIGTEILHTWLQLLFAEAGFDVVLPALGDHDIGDNNWPVGSDMAGRVGEMKELFGEIHIDPLNLPGTWNGVPTRAPAGLGQYDEGSYLYALDNVLFLTLDPFEWESGATRLGTRGAVAIDYTAEHLAWIAEVLEAAEAAPEIDHVIVQAHVPVLGPVNSRISSEVALDNGPDSEFWQLLQSFGTNAGGKVRAYLNGEVHATTLIHDEASGIVQISHGSLMVADDTYFVAFEVFEDRIVANEYRIQTGRGDVDPVWRVTRDVDQTRDVVLSGAEVVGSVEIDVSTGTTLFEATGSMAGSFERSGFRTFVGGESDDRHTADNRDNPMFGRGGDDTLDGFIGNDTLLGEAGNDHLLGGSGDDRLEGGAGGDQLDGGPGFDLARYTASPTAVDVRLFNNQARLGHAEGDSLAGIEGLVGSSFGDTLMGSPGNNRIFAGAGDDLVFVGFGNDRVQTGPGNDTVSGQDGDDALYGDAGSDSLNGDAGDDSLFGGTGDDAVRGGDGNDALQGDAGKDMLSGDGGNDLVDGGDGHDTIQGHGGDDTLRGGPGRDLLIGNSGNDDLGGGSWHDTLNAGAGDDVLVGWTGHDVLNGQSGNDTLEGNAGDDALWGGSGSDLLLGGRGNDSLHGQDGDDVIEGGLWSDTVRAGAGNDTARGGNGRDDIAGDGGHDRLSGGQGRDTLHGNQGADTLRGGDGADLLEGGRGADTLLGGLGADTLVGGGGDDLLRGGAGPDTFIFGNAAGTDRIEGFETDGAGADLLRFTGSAVNSFQEFLDGARQQGTAVRFQSDTAEIDITLARTRLADLTEDHVDFV